MGILAIPDRLASASSVFFGARGDITRTGKRKKTSPYQRLGVLLPPDLSWWHLLQLTPDQLRTLLSALPPAE